MVFLKILFFSIILLGIGFAGIGVKMLFKKDYTFKNSVQPLTLTPENGWDAHVEPARATTTAQKRELL